MDAEKGRSIKNLQDVLTVSIKIQGAVSGLARLATPYHIEVKIAQERSGRIG